MKPGFMSSVCPQQTLPELIETANRYGYKGLEFRVEWDHQHGIELDASDMQIESAKQQLDEAGIVCTCIATGVQFNSDDADQHVRQQEILKQYIELAASVGAPFLRTFGDPVPEEDASARDVVLSLAAQSYAAVDEQAKQHGVYVLIETHTNMRAHWARQVIDKANVQRLGVLWHIGHHIGYGQSVDDAYIHIKDDVHHLHFNLGGRVTNDDNQRTFELLKPDGFDGFFSVEVINPDEPEVVLQHHIDKFNHFMNTVV